MVEVTRISPLTGNVNKMYLDISQEQIAEWNAPAEERRLIQDIFPNLNDDEREFIMTGYTPADWRALHGE
tara:strand:+ start:2609 stop:2818 length:210 start_codon:yes stop_codon:yes gene_type:complete